MYSKLLSYFFPVALQPDADHGLLSLEVSRSHKMTHQSRYDSSGRVIGSSQRSLHDNTQRSKQTNVYAPPGGIRTHNLRRRVAAELRLIPRGHWDRLVIFFHMVKLRGKQYYNLHTVVQTAVLVTLQTCIFLVKMNDLPLFVTTQYVSKFRNWSTIYN